MTASRLMAVIFVFFCTLIAWMFLGNSLVQRTGQADTSGRPESEVERLPVRLRVWAARARATV